jgi:G6PDH family F420-dependent oxidoreductase
MLEEAIEVIRTLWRGGMQSHRGRFYSVEDARIYDLPDELPRIAVAASGPEAAELAGRCGDALVSVAPKEELVEAFAKSGNGGARYGQVTVCWAEDEQTARRTALEYWPNAALPGKLFTELPLPEHFEQLGNELVTEEKLAESIICGPEPTRHLEGIRKFAEVGFDSIYVHQVGPDQEGFLRFYSDEVIPRLADLEPLKVA